MPDEEQAADAVEYDVVIDGEKLSEDWADDLSFREQREFRDTVRELIGDSKADVDIENLAIVDWLPALVYMRRKRKDPEYTLEQALEGKPTDFLVEQPKSEGGTKVPPTSGAKRRPARKR